MSTNCPICNNETKTYYKCHYKQLLGLHKKYDQKINICPQCQLVFVSNPIEKERLNNYYKFFNKYEGEEGKGHVDLNRLRMSKCQYQFITNEIDDFNTVLDIGASTGYTLAYFKQNGYKVFGIDPSVKNKKYAEQIYGINLFEGTFDQYYKQDRKTKFDLIFLSHVLEHIVNPRQFIQKISEINNKYLFIEVPSFELHYVDEPYGVFYYEHVNYFTVESLSYLMNTCGYKPVKIDIQMKMENTHPNFPCLVTLWEKDDEQIKKSFHMVNQSFTLLEQYLNKSEIDFKKVKRKIDEINNDTKLAIWGTGSHTSRLFGMTDLLNKNIVKFYDSDIKKQCLTMLDKDITAFDINDFTSGKVEKVLISTFAGEKSISSYLDSLDIKVDYIALYT